MRRAILLASALLVALGLTGCAPSEPAAPDTPRPATVTTRSATPSPVPTPVEPGATIAALGDSLSLGFDACNHYGDCPSVSWSTGSDPTVDSIATRLRDRTGSPVAVHTDARAGVRVADLPRQVDLAIAQRPTIVTVLIGGNDVCAAHLSDMTGAEDYSGIVDAQLHRLAAELPEATILVASVPDVTNLLPVAAANPTARFLWRTLGGCTTVLADPLSTSPAAEERRAAVRERIDEYNSALAATCATIDRCLWDGGALHDYQPTIAQLSPLDYFHPSVAGLRELAQIEWQALTAPAA